MHGNVKEETERLLKAPGTCTNYQKEHIKNKCVIMLTINLIMFVPAATLSCVCVCLMCGSDRDSRKHKKSACVCVCVGGGGGTVLSPLSLFEGSSLQRSIFL